MRRKSFKNACFEGPKDALKQSIMSNESELKRKSIGSAEIHENINHLFIGNKFLNVFYVLN